MRAFLWRSVAEIVGYGSPAMTEHYSRISTAAKLEVIKALPEQKGPERHRQMVCQKVAHDPWIAFSETPETVEQYLKLAIQC